MGYCRLFLSDDILDLFAEETSSLCKKKLLDTYGGDYKDTVLASYGKGNSLPYLFCSKGISKEDILAFIGIKVYMDLHPLADIKGYWNHGTKFINIGTVMSKNYFFLISKYFHFPDKDGSPGQENKKYESYLKVGPKNQINAYFTKLCKNFQKYYELGENINIDEFIQHFIGSKKPNNITKQNKERYKIHLLSDYNTNYVYNLFFDQGKNATDHQAAAKSTSLIENVVFRLLSCLNDKKKRNLFLDESYSSPNIMKKLAENVNFNTTVLNSKTKPKLADDLSMNEETESKNGNSDNSKNSKIFKNKGIEAFDYDFEIANSDRSMRRWYAKVIINGMDSCMINAKILYESKAGTKSNLPEFKEKICKQIFKMYREFEKKNNPNSEKNDVESKGPEKKKVKK